MTIECQEYCTKDRTDNCSSFVVFVDCFINHLLALLFSDVVLRFNFIHPVRHLGDCPSGQVTHLL